MKDMRLLILEDSRDDADLMQATLKRAGLHFNLKVVSTRKDFIDAMDSFAPEIILSDHKLPQFSSNQALQICRKKLPYVPFILVTGAASDEFASSIIKEGADDYILKDRLSRLPAAITSAVKQRRSEKEKQETIELLKENEEKYRTLVERISDGFIALDVNWNFIYINKKGEQLFNKPADYLVGKNIWTQFPEAIDKVFYKAYHQAMQRQENIHLREYSFFIDKWVETNIYPSSTGVSVYFRDVTEQRKAEENLKLLEKKVMDQKIQEQKKIARAMIIAQERERNNLGEELHDNINQILAGTKLYLGMIGNKSAQLKKLMKYPIELIDSSIEEIRSLCRKMVTPLKNIDLGELVQRLLNELSQNSTIKTAFTCSISNKFLSDDLKLNIYRIIQEQTNNILKYAEAKNVNISIKKQNKVLNIIVADDGKGFKVSSKRKGIGISNMINRIESYNGKIEIKSREGNGCKIFVSIPV
jgi:two-component system, NarL family, sensor histidine kinase UhpB